MKKRLLLLGVLMVLFPLNVFASSGSIKASVSSSKVTLNNTFTVTVSVNVSGDKIGAIDYILDYDKSKLTLVSGDLHQVPTNFDGTATSKSYTLKFRAIATGTAEFSFSKAKIAGWDSVDYIPTSSSGTSVTIKEAVVVNYSSDNNLKSLSVDDFEISPKFDKSVLEYSITVLPTTTSVKVNAKANDSKAKVSISGTDVVEGVNNVSVVVTAENGSKKTYVIKVTVPEKDPIKHKFGKEEYSILRKLPEALPNNFTASTIKFGEEEVASLVNEKLNMTLIYLRDSKNKDGFYIYNKEKDTVSIFNSIKNNDTEIYITDVTDEADNLFKTNVKINDSIVSAYQIKDGSKFYIIKGTNILTNKSNLYLYDSENNSISIYNSDDIDSIYEEINLYKLITYGLGGAIVLLVIILILVGRNKHKIKQLSEKLEDTKEDDKKSDE